jgi:hypothetical protein
VAATVCCLGLAGAAQANAATFTPPPALAQYMATHPGGTLAAAQMQECGTTLSSPAQAISMVESGVPAGESLH